MNTSRARKIGEVLAFAEVGINTFKRGNAGLQEVFSEEDLNNINQTQSSHRDEIIKIASERSVLETVTDKAAATGEKLLSMQDLYLSEDDWEDTAELLEWLGFFEGAAIVHWSLVSGIAEIVEEGDALRTLSHGANQFHRDILDIIAAYAADVGEGMK